MGPINPDGLRFNRFGLSQQESRVLALAMSGRIDKAIAEEMGISLGTVRVYWKRIRTKVGGTRSEVIAELARNSLKLDYETMRDESELRIRELEIFESFFRRFPIPIALLDGPEGDILRANDAFASLHGYELEELSNHPSGNLEIGTSVRVRKDGSTFQAEATLTEGEGWWTLALDVDGGRPLL